jgi:6-phosphogluconolactonase (cycloisomerase 2 family)
MVDPSGRFAYVANVNSDDISRYTIAATTGALTAVGTVRTRSAPTSIALTRGTAPVTITPRFAYVANTFSHDISGYTINASSGALTPIPGSPFAAGAGTIPNSVTVDPSGRFAYAANSASTNILGNTLGYTINASSGALTPISGSPFAAGSQPESVTVDPSDRFVYVTNFGSNNISGYTITASSGALTPIPGSPFAAGTAPFSVTVDPSGRFTYVANQRSNNISGYTITASSGVLTPIAGSPFPAGVVLGGVITSGITQ